MKKTIIALAVIVLVGVAGYFFMKGDNASNTTAPSSAETATSTPITMAEVAKHNSAASCYAAINGNVYDLTSWINQHPGGPDRILALCGTDGSAAFNGQHGGQARPESELATFKIGALAQ